MPGALTLVVPADGARVGGLVGLLGQTNHRLRLARDADDALETLSQEPFDLVLLDTSGSGCDGAQILQHLKCDSRVWHIPVIVVGSPDDVEGIVRCLGLGAEDYVLQPLHPALVTLRINALLAKRRLQELETEYIKIFEEQSADLGELKRELTQRILHQFEELERLPRLLRLLPTEVTDLTNWCGLGAAGARR